MFEHIVRANIASLQDCDVTKFSQSDTSPHYMIRQVAELCGTLTALQGRYPIEGEEEYLLGGHELVRKIEGEDKPVKYKFHRNFKIQAND